MTLHPERSQESTNKGPAIDSSSPDRINLQTHPGLARVWGLDQWKPGWDIQIQEGEENDLKIIAKPKTRLHIADKKTPPPPKARELGSLKPGMQVVLNPLSPLFEKCPFSGTITSIQQEPASSFQGRTPPFPTDELIPCVTITPLQLEGKTTSDGPLIVPVVDLELYFLIPQATEKTLSMPAELRQTLKIPENWEIYYTPNDEIIAVPGSEKQEAPIFLGCIKPGMKISLLSNPEQEWVIDFTGWEYPTAAIEDPESYPAKKGLHPWIHLCHPNNLKRRTQVPIEDINLNFLLNPNIGVTQSRTRLVEFLLHIIGRKN